MRVISAFAHVLEFCCVDSAWVSRIFVCLSSGPASRCLGSPSNQQVFGQKMCFGRWQLLIGEFIQPVNQISFCHHDMSPKFTISFVTSSSPATVLERFVYCVGSIFASYARARLSEQFARHAFLKAIVRGKCGIWWTWRVWKSCFVKLSSSVPWNMMMILCGTRGTSDASSLFFVAGAVLCRPWMTLAIN